MYSIKRRSITFDTQNSEDVRQYEEIMNNPLCTITSNNVNITKEVQHDPDSGRPMMTIEKIMRSVEWSEKVLL
jgi:hypothetical protein